MISANMICSILTHAILFNEGTIHKRMCKKEWKLVIANDFHCQHVIYCQKHSRKYIILQILNEKALLLFILCLPLYFRCFLSLIIVSFSVFMLPHFHDRCFFLLSSHPGIPLLAIVLHGMKIFQQKTLYYALDYDYK